MVAFGPSPFAAVEEFLRTRATANSDLGPHPIVPKAPVIQFDSMVNGRAPLGHAHGTPQGGKSPMWRELESAFPGLKFTSGYRDPAHNARVGGAKNSYHMRKDNPAHDYVGSPRDMQAAAAWARAKGAREVLVHNAGSGQHLHIAW